MFVHIFLEDNVLITIHYVILLQGIFGNDSNENGCARDMILDDICFSSCLSLNRIQNVTIQYCLSATK